MGVDETRCCGGEALLGLLEGALGLQLLLHGLLVAPSVLVGSSVQSVVLEADIAHCATIHFVFSIPSFFSFSFFCFFAHFFLRKRERERERERERDKSLEFFPVFFL